MWFLLLYRWGNQDTKKLKKKKKKNLFKITKEFWGNESLFLFTQIPLAYYIVMLLKRKLVDITVAYPESIHPFHVLPRSLSVSPPLPIESGTSEKLTHP